MKLLAKDGIYITDFPRHILVANIPSAGRADIMVRCNQVGFYNVTEANKFGATTTIMKLWVTG